MQTKQSLLFAIILLEGFVTISLEILTMRQLIPVVGASVIVTSLIIGVFLLFLAYGYRQGGCYEKNYVAILKKNFTCVAIGLGIGLSYLFIESFFSTAQRYLGQSVFIPLTLYLLLVTAPLVYLLGQTVPITFNLFKQGEHSIGALSGKVLHVSTLGSFLGAVLTSLLLMNYLGVAWTVFINFAVLACLVLLLSHYQQDALRLLILLVAGIVIYGLNIKVEQQSFVLTNSYANYRIINNFELTPNQKGKLLDINDSSSSFLDSHNTAFPYVEFIKKILFDDLQLTHKQILVLGAGGFTLSANNDRENTFTYVDIDPQIKAVAEKYFIDPIRGKFVADDARHYLAATTQRYDVVVVDVYSNRMSIPMHLVTRDYFLQVQNVLQPNGIVIVNLIAHPMLDDPYSKRMDNTIRSVFSSCMVMPAAYTARLTNILYVCRRTTAAEDQNIYTDNLNRSTLDFFNSH